MRTQIKVMSASEIGSDSQTVFTSSSAASNNGVHTVGKSDTLWNISQRYGTTVEVIKELNDLNTNTIYLGQKLSVPKQN